MRSNLSKEAPKISKRLYGYKLQQGFSQSSDKILYFCICLEKTCSLCSALIYQGRWICYTKVKVIFKSKMVLSYQHSRVSANIVKVFAGEMTLIGVVMIVESVVVVGIMKKLLRQCCLVSITVKTSFVQFAVSRACKILIQ